LALCLSEGSLAEGRIFTVSAPGGLFYSCTLVEAVPAKELKLYVTILETFADKEWLPTAGVILRDDKDRDVYKLGLIAIPNHEGVFTPNQLFAFNSGTDSQEDANLYYPGKHVRLNERSTFELTWSERPTKVALSELMQSTFRLSQTPVTARLVVSGMKVLVESESESLPDCIVGDA